ncbi:hypothetical protein JCM16303_004456 [Sporobolomyces ruberrimus]
MEGTVDPIALKYLDKLPLALSPFPRFSSSASHSLASKRSGLHPTKLSTKCNACRAEIVGGINGSYWTERGQLWVRCEGCRAVTKRGTNVEEGQGGKGRGAFGSVKKRRKELARRAREAASHPTQFRSTTALPQAAVTTTTVGKGKRALDAPGSLAQPLPVATDPGSSTDSPLPSSSSTASAPKPSQPQAKAPSSSKISRLSSIDGITPSPVTTPSPSSLDSKLASKKRKRSKQPNGLAELLAKKKKDEGTSAAGGSGGGGGGLGLQDFLQGL